MRGLKHIAAFVAALALTACVFSSEQALFAAADAAYPIADGSRFNWQAPDEAPIEVTFHRTADGYEITNGDQPDERMNVLFAAIPETTANDYVVQWRADRPDEGYAYAFLWPTRRGYRVYLAPSTFREAKGWSTYCDKDAPNACALRDRAAVFALYQDVIYPAISANRGAPQANLELTLIEAPPPPGKT